MHAHDISPVPSGVRAAQDGASERETSTVPMGGAEHYVSSTRHCRHGDVEAAKPLCRCVCTPSRALVCSQGHGVSCALSLSLFLSFIFSFSLVTLTHVVSRACSFLSSIQSLHSQFHTYTETDRQTDRHTQPILTCITPYPQ